MRIHVAERGDRFKNCTHSRKYETKDGVFCAVCHKQIPFAGSEDVINDIIEEEMEKEEFARLKNTPIIQVGSVWLNANSGKETTYGEQCFGKVIINPDDEPHWMSKFASNGWTDYVCSRCGYIINTECGVGDVCPRCKSSMKGGVR